MNHLVKLRERSPLFNVAATHAISYSLSAEVAASIDGVISSGAWTKIMVSSFEGKWCGTA